MSIQTVNISCNEVKEQLALGKLPSGWEVEAGELDVLCINTPKFELGYIVTLNIRDKAYDFTVHEFAMDRESGIDSEDDNTFGDYEGALDHIARRVEFYKEA